MARDEDAPGDRLGNHLEWLDLDSPDTMPSSQRRPFPARLKIGMVLAVLALLAFVVTTQRARQSSIRAVPGPAQRTSTVLDPTAAPSTIDAPPPPVSLITLGHPVLGVTEGWELYGRAPGMLVRIQLARGLITRTVVPGLLSSGPVSFVASADGAIVRPIDRVPGYRVTNDRWPDPIALAPGSGGPVFPGPSPSTVWMQTGDDVRPTLTLSELDGNRPTASIVMPADSSPLQASTDGAGYLLFTRPDGTYQARPGVLRRLTSGTVLAAGPTGWVDARCDSRHRCALSLISRANGSRRSLGYETGGLPGGAVSPDGSTAAILEASPAGAVRLYLLDLSSGNRRPVTVAMSSRVQIGTIVFSPDSRWLFAVTARGKVTVIDPRTAGVTDLGAPLPALSQLAVKPTSRN